MKLSLPFIYLKLKDEFPDVRLEERRENLYCSSCQLFADTSEQDDDVIYALLHKGRGSAGFPERVPLLLKEEDADCFPDNPKIIVPLSGDLNLVFDRMLRIFRRYSSWSLRLNDAIVSNKSLQSILEIVTEVIDNPMYFADLSFKMLAVISRDLEEISVIWRYQIKYGYLPYHVMTSLISTGELELLNNSPQAFYAQTKSFGRSFVSKSIKYKGKLQGYFFIVELYHKLDACDIELAEYIGNTMAKAVYKDQNYLKINHFYHEHFMVDILENTLTDRKLINDQLQPFGWNIHGDYVLLAVHMPNVDDALRRHAIALLTERYVPQAFIYNQYAVVIINRAAAKIGEIGEHLKKMMDYLGRQGGLSEIFTDFSLLGTYFKQALVALEQGRKREPAGSIYLYKDYFLDHLIEIGAEGIPVHNAVCRLNEYDEENHTEFCQTLFTYLINERNQAKASQILFLHRNTLKHRIDKIEGIIDVDLDNPQLRLRLIYSLYEMGFSERSL